MEDVSEGTPEEARTLLAAAPDGLVADLARVVADGNQVAWRQGVDLPYGVRHDKFPYDFRANVEVGLLQLGKKFGSAGVTAVEAQNGTGNWHHSELRFGPIVLTASAVESADTMVRDARFRRSLAKNPQLPLGIVEMEEDPPSDGLYAVLLYPSGAFTLKAEQAQPSFVMIRFPTSDCATYLNARIDALAALRASQRAREAAEPKLAKRREDEAG